MFCGGIVVVVILIVFKKKVFSLFKNLGKKNTIVMSKIFTDAILRLGCFETGRSSDSVQSIVVLCCARTFLHSSTVPLLFSEHYNNAEENVQFGKNVCKILTQSHTLQFASSLRCTPSAFVEPALAKI
jgi:hypothetical protein